MLKTSSILLCLFALVQPASFAANHKAVERMGDVIIQRNPDGSIETRDASGPTTVRPEGESNSGAPTRSGQNKGRSGEHGAKAEAHSASGAGQKAHAAPMKGALVPQMDSRAGKADSHPGAGQKAHAPVTAHNVPGSAAHQPKSNTHAVANGAHAAPTAHSAHNGQKKSGFGGAPNMPPVSHESQPHPRLASQRKAAGIKPTGHLPFQ